MASDRLLFRNKSGGHLAGRSPISSGRQPQEIPEFPTETAGLFSGGEDILMDTGYYDAKKVLEKLGIRPWTVIYGIQPQQYETPLHGNERWRYSEGEH